MKKSDVHKLEALQATLDRMARHVGDLLDDIAWEQEAEHYPGVSVWRWTPDKVEVVDFKPVLSNCVEFDIKG